MSEQRRIEIAYFTDVLCVWAYVAEARVAELQEQFGGQVQITRHYCSVFGDTAHKIGEGWRDRGGYSGFGAHVHEVAAKFGHVTTQTGIWTTTRPASCTGAHLLLKAAQCLEAGGGPAPGGGPEPSSAALAWDLRMAFFRDGRDIGRWAILREIAAARGVDVEAIQQTLDDGRAYAALARDARLKEDFRIEGSPTFVLDGGRQKLYGNVGYRVLEANVRELLREPASGAASWC